MMLKSAMFVKKLAVFSSVLSVSGLAAFLLLYFEGRVEFKYFSLPVMACFISVTWLAFSKAAVETMKAEQSKVKNDDTQA